FPRPAACLTEAQQQAPTGIEDLNIVKKRIDNIDVAEGINRRPFGTAELARAVAQAPQLAFELTLGIYYLNAVIHRIGHKQISSPVRSRMSWKVKLPLACAATAKFRLIFPLAIKNDDAMTLGIGNNEVVLEQCQARGSHQVVGDLEEQFSG